MEYNDSFWKKYTIEHVFRDPKLKFYITHGVKYLLSTSKFNALYLFELDLDDEVLSIKQKPIFFSDGSLTFSDTGTSDRAVYPVGDDISCLITQDIRDVLEENASGCPTLLATLNTKSMIDWVFGNFSDIVESVRETGGKSLTKTERNKLINEELFFQAIDSMGISIDSTKKFKHGRRKSKNVRPVLDFVSDYTVIDIETTGIDPDNHSITELAAIRIRDHKIDSTFQILIDPEKEIPQEVVELTGITNEMVAGQPRLDEVYDVFKEFIGDDILVGHNILGFDADFINTKMSENPLTNKAIDTLWVARKIMGDELKNLKLGTICSAFGIENTGAHRALSDAEATWQCYERLAAYANENGLSIENVRYRNWKASDIKPSEEARDDKPLEGKVFAFTGNLDCIDRKTAFQRIVDFGGVVKDGVTLKTDYLVVVDPESSTNKQRKAIGMQENGHHIQIIDPDTFYRMVEIGNTP